ncbi:unnamed protein product [Pedinophyceae sp. YPF-701]|nr:unnamed protein product [Pedinophyceae sp. YPF-701]
MQAHFPRHQQRQHAAQPAQPARRPAPLQVKASSNDTAQPSISRVDLGEASRPLSLDGSATSPHAQAARLWAPGPESPALAVPDTDNAVSPAPAAARKTVQLPGNGPAPAALSSYVIEVGDDSAATSGGVSDRDLDSTAGTPKPATPIREDSRERLRMRSEREQEEVDAFLALERGLTGGP